ncbi:unnamed protein product [Caenorhabditis angaria]|uniref:Uncharacterized protein n=1 Tax=Caenorhabditis angaria TaxID=860376 RepID=A0A9P1J1F5_9PELO|nr:unnamed protein product [Caenorhabditis angaria]
MITVRAKQMQLLMQLFRERIIPDEIESKCYTRNGPRSMIVVFCRVPVIDFFIPYLFNLNCVPVILKLLIY